MEGQICPSRILVRPVRYVRELLGDDRSLTSVEVAALHVHRDDPTSFVVLVDDHVHFRTFDPEFIRDDQPVPAFEQDALSIDGDRRYNATRSNRFTKLDTISANEEREQVRDRVDAFQAIFLQYFFTYRWFHKPFNRSRLGESFSRGENKGLGKPLPPGETDIFPYPLYPSGREGGYGKMSLASFSGGVFPFSQVIFPLGKMSLWKHFSSWNLVTRLLIACHMSLWDFSRATYRPLEKNLVSDQLCDKASRLMFPDGRVEPAGLRN